MHGGGGLDRTWRGLVGAHRDLERTPWGARLLGNLWPAYLFALIVAARLWGLLQPARRAALADSAYARAALAQEVVTLLFLALVVVLFIVRRPVRGARAGWREGVVALAGTFLLNAVAFLPVGAAESTAQLVAASLLILLGTAFSLWGLSILGRCFGLLPEARGLVLRGPYRLVRHPLYLGEIVSGFGLVLARPHPVVVALFVAFVALQVQRTVYEERALTAAFPDEYPAYRRRVARLVPGWRRS